ARVVGVSNNPTVTYPPASAAGPDDRVPVARCVAAGSGHLSRLGDRLGLGRAGGQVRQFSDFFAVDDSCGAVLGSGRNGARAVDVVRLNRLRKLSHGVFGQVPQHIWAAVRARPRGSDGEVTADAGDHAVLSAVEHGQFPVLTVGVPDHR